MKEMLFFYRGRSCVLSFYNCDFNKKISDLHPINGQFSARIYPKSNEFIIGISTYPSFHWQCFQFSFRQYRPDVYDFRQSQGQSIVQRYTVLPILRGGKFLLDLSRYFRFQLYRFGFWAIAWLSWAGPRLRNRIATWRKEEKNTVKLDTAEKYTLAKLGT